MSERKRSSIGCTQETSNLSREKLEVDRTVDEENKKKEEEEGQKKSRKSEGNAPPKVVKEEITKEDEKALRDLEYYHGYIAREDLSSLMKAEGDFIVRMTEVEIGKSLKKEIVLSVMIAAGEDAVTAADATAAANNTNVKPRNVVIRRAAGHYRVEAIKTFKTVRELVDHYKKNYGQVNKSRFILRNAVVQQVWEFTHLDVKFTGKVLGEGAYGMVKAGTLNLTKKKGPTDVKVAVKMAKGTSELCKAKIKEMMREARLMRNLQHKNVVKLYGVAVLEQPLYIILELINGGELKGYLKTNIGKVNVIEKLKMCHGAANGLEYLHKAGYIHRDIAARNCLYTDDKIVKISDFGLSRRTSEYKLKRNSVLPIKWLSPETIEKFVFTVKSDMYSFGVLLWEIFNDGVEPWGNVSNADVKKSVLGGKFLEFPTSCPEKLRNFVKESIFLKDPTKRASMTEASQVIDGVLKEELPQSDVKGKGENGKKSGGVVAAKKSKKIGERTDG